MEVETDEDGGVGKKDGQEGLVQRLLALGGPVEIMTIFQMGHMTSLSTQIHSSIPQYDMSKVLLKKNEWQVPFGCVKVTIYLFSGFLVRFVVGE